jgi:hypothetical protein
VPYTFKGWLESREEKSILVSVEAAVAGITDAVEKNKASNTMYFKELMTNLRQVLVRFLPDRQFTEFATAESQ